MVQCRRRGSGRGSGCLLWMESRQFRLFRLLLLQCGLLVTVGDGPGHCLLTLLLQHWHLLLGSAFLVFASTSHGHVRVFAHSGHVERLKCINLHGWRWWCLFLVVDTGIGPAQRCLFGRQLIIIRKRIVGGLLFVWRRIGRQSRRRLSCGRGGALATFGIRGGGGWSSRGVCGDGGGGGGGGGGRGGRRSSSSSSSSRRSGKDSGTVSQHGHEHG
jgi:hypothetical protein